MPLLSSAGRLVVTAGRLLPVLTAAALLSACANTTSGTPARASTTESSPVSVTEASSPDATTSQAAEQGEAMGSVDAIEVFSDPATEIKSSADLTAYLLPGLTGAGVDCVESALDVDAVLAMSVEEGADEVTDTVLDCIRYEDMGNIVAMYAVGLGEDGPEWYDRVSSCASQFLFKESNAEVRSGLQSIYAARLDLPAPPTSPDIAFEFLLARSDCLMWLTDTVPTPTPEVPQTPDTTTSEGPEVPNGPVADKTIKWDLLSAGDCVVDIPDGEFFEVTVTDCANPHESEVVGSNLAMAGMEQSDCSRAFDKYTGGNRPDAGDYYIDYLLSSDTFSNPKLICLASPVAGGQITGSIAAA